MALRLITAPATQPITLAAAKLHLKIDDAAEDTWLQAAIESASLAAEHETGRRWITQTWEAIYDAFPAGAIELGLSPVQEVVSVKYLSQAGTEQTLATEAYVLDADHALGVGYVLPASSGAWPATAASANAVRVRFTVGYGADATAVPAQARQWMLMHIGTACRMRESMAAGFTVTELPNRYHDALLDGLRVYRL
ncbi:MAG: phage head-tail connector protein [Rubrivivax sp.]|jgi:uncharacterized phiE125 gp8 family phage protein|nr:phage head-tail connector protein [Rubrivivax sp.]